MDKKKHEINTKDVIANFRVADTLLLKVTDFFLSVPFLANPLLWKILFILFILTMPLSAIITSFSTFLGVAYIFMGNTMGVIVVVITVAYIIWLMKGTLLNQKSDFKLTDLKGWSKIWMIVIIITLITSAMLNIWISNVAWAISVLVRNFISITLTMYLAPFMCRYFFGVVIDGLEHHQESTHHPHAKVKEDRVSVVKE